MMLTEHELWVEIREAMRGERTFVQRWEAGVWLEPVLVYGFCNLVEEYLFADAISLAVSTAATARAMAATKGYAYIEPATRDIKRKRAVARFIEETR